MSSWPSGHVFSKRGSKGKGGGEGIDASYEVADGVELLARGRELATLDRAVARAVAGSGTVVCIAGQAGMGKTALLEAVAARAEAAGLAVLRAAGSPLQTPLPLGLVRGLVDIDQPAAARGSTRPATREAAVRRLLALVRDRPAALLVDDAHWADPSSLDTLAVLARSTVGARLLLAVAAQPRRPPDRRLARLLAAAPPEQAIALEPLSVSHTAETIATELGIAPAAVDAAACHAVTGGRPLHARLLAAELKRRNRTSAVIGRDDVEVAAASSFAALVDRHLADDELAVRLVAAAAALGGGSSPDAAARVAGCEPAAATAAALGLADVGLIETPDSLELAHPLLGDAAVARLQARDRSELQARAAAELRDQGAAPAAIAACLLHVKPSGDAESAELLRHAARSAGSSVAPATAVEYLRRALAEPPPAEAIPELLLELGAAQVRAGHRDAVPCLRRALDAAGADEALRTRAVRALAAALARQGDGIDAAALLEQRIEQLVEGPREQVLQLELDHAGLASLSPALHARVRARLAADRWRLGDGSPTERALRAARAEYEAVAAGSADRAAEVVLGAADHAPQGPDRGTLHAGRSIWLLLRAERYAEAAGLMEEGLARVDRAGAPGDASVFHAQSAYLQLQLGATDAAEREARRSLELAEAHGFRIALDLAAAYLARSLLEQDRLQDAVAAVERGSLGWDTPAPSPSRPGSFGATQLLLSRGRLRIANGDAARGLADLLEVGAQKRRVDVANPAGFPWLGPAVDVLVARGDRERAVGLLDEPLAAAERWGSPASLAQTLVAAGRARRETGLLRRAARLVADSPARATRAEIALALALAHAEAGSNDSARELVAAASLADSCGMARLARHARAALDVGGGAAVVDGLADLSDRELDVVRLLVEGMTNVQIATALSISPRTVQAHLANAMGKTKVRRRTELATLALRQRIV